MPEQEPKNKKQTALLIVSIVLVVLCAAAAAAVVILGSGKFDFGEPTESATQSTAPTTLTPTTTAPPTTTEPTEPPVKKVSTATLVSMGDILMHGPVRQTYITTGYYDANGALVETGHNYDPVFQYLRPYTETADYNVINLETPLAGFGLGYPYSGVIGSFNAPDAILDGAKSVGFDMFLTANNHTYDCGSFGMHRTMEVILEKELAYLGTQQSADEPDYKVLELSGISIGMACYTYEVTTGDPNHKSLNGKWVTTADAPLVSSFDYAWMDLFYAQAEADIAAMKEAGAEFIVLYTHWGDEYQLTGNATQQAIAQRLCDLGADVIIGGHPHVVQPVELFTSTVDPEHKTVCLYSMGNAVSAQRRDKMRLNTGHTEDGVLFSLSFSKYSDGTVILEDADILPTWVNDKYQILPIDHDPEVRSLLGVSDGELLQMESSYSRTMAIVGSGLETVQNYLRENTALVEAALGIRD